MNNRRYLFIIRFTTLISCSRAPTKRTSLKNTLNVRSPCLLTEYFVLHFLTATTRTVRRTVLTLVFDRHSYPSSVVSETVFKTCLTVKWSYYYSLDYKYLIKGVGFETRCTNRTNCLLLLLHILRIHLTDSCMHIIDRFSPKLKSRKIGSVISTRDSK